MERDRDPLVKAIVDPDRIPIANPVRERFHSDSCRNLNETQCCSAHAVVAIRHGRMHG